MIPDMRDVALPIDISETKPPDLKRFIAVSNENTVVVVDYFLCNRGGIVSGCLTVLPLLKSLPTVLDDCCLLVPHQHGARAVERRYPEHIPSKRNVGVLQGIFSASREQILLHPTFK